MKLRLQGNTVRLRLRRSDIEKLAASGRVAESVDLAPNPLIYSLVLDENVSVACAEMRQSGEISVRLPKQAGLAWCLGSETSIESTNVTPTVLIERDFVRTSVEDADDFDRFMNPRSGRKPPPRNPRS